MERFWRCLKFFYKSRYINLKNNNFSYFWVPLICVLYDLCNRMLIWLSHIAKHGAECHCNCDMPFWVCCKCFWLSVNVGTANILGTLQVLQDHHNHIMVYWRLAVPFTTVASSCSCTRPFLSSFISSSFDSNKKPMVTFRYFHLSWTYLSLRYGLFDIDFYCCWYLYITASGYNSLVSQY